jgi:hypothetical protein
MPSARSRFAQSLHGPLEVGHFEEGRLVEVLRFEVFIGGPQHGRMRVPRGLTDTGGSLLRQIKDARSPEDHCGDQAERSGRVRTLRSSGVASRPHATTPNGYSSHQSNVRLRLQRLRP